MEQVDSIFVNISERKEDRMQTAQTILEMGLFLNPPLLIQLGLDVPVNRPNLFIGKGEWKLYCQKFGQRYADLPGYENITATLLRWISKIQSSDDWWSKANGLIIENFIWESMRNRASVVPNGTIENSF